MLTVLGSPRTCCDGITRRESLQAGGLAMLGGMFGIPRFATAAAERAAGGGKAKSVIVLYLLGGAPTQDMWDMKPEAPGGVGKRPEKSAGRTARQATLFLLHTGPP